jgi:hypothetical protein
VRNLLQPRQPQEFSRSAPSSSSPTGHAGRGAPPRAGPL